MATAITPPASKIAVKNPTDNATIISQIRFISAIGHPTIADAI